MDEFGKRRNLGFDAELIFFFYRLKRLENALEKIECRFVMRSSCFLLGSCRNYMIKSPVRTLEKFFDTYSAVVKF